MSELTAIGWVVSPIIKKMLDRIPSYIMGQYYWERDMERDLEKLQGTLLRLQVVVDKAKRWQTMEDSQNQLLRQLQDAVYEADDLLDEFEYRIMKARAKEAESSSTVSLSHAAFSPLEFAKRFVGLDELRGKLTETLKKLDDLKESIYLFITVAGLEKHIAVEQVHEVSSSRVTSSILPETKVFGRDKKKDEIVSLLLKTVNELGSSYTCISVIPIVGDGGIGKTTLAQLVYNDQRIRSAFHPRIWICVSDSFDEMRLTREMLECASMPNEKHKDIMNFDMLQKKLQSKIKSKRFMLVLDDVWIDEKKGKVLNCQMWNKLLAPLKDGAKDSKILVTTRMGIVAEIFEIFGGMNSVSLEGLTKDETWSLLKECAFGKENPNNYPELQEIGMQIVERLNGSPLASKVVGSMLKDRLEAKKWMEILEREMFDDDVMSILRVSYQRLPDRLKPCFAYCSIFPKDWQFDPEKLVLLWIAQGYIEPSIRNQRQMVDVGMDYFNELLSRSFFQKVGQHSHIHYILHDLMHDLAQSVSMYECFRLDSGKQRTIMQPLRHLGVAINFEDEIIDFVACLEKTSCLKNLRSLIFYSKWHVKCRVFPPSMFKGLRCLRVLDFGGLCVDGFPESMGVLTHLRYLNLGDNFFQALPESLCGLFHLQVLGSLWGMSFSKSIIQLNKFGKLTRLDVPVLEFKVKEGRHLRELKNMSVLLERLHIKSIENVTTKEEALEANIVSKQNIDELMLEWHESIRGEQERHDANEGDTGLSEQCIDELLLECHESTGREQERHEVSNEDLDVEVLEALQPHPNLKRLELVDFSGTRSPSWLKTKWLISLKALCLSNCRCLEVLPPLGHLPSLKDLRLRGVHALKRVGSEFYGLDNNGVRGFPSLEVLYFEDMPAWSEWCGVEFPVFPRLCELRVRQSPMLMRLPLLPRTLTTIYIYHTGLISKLQSRPLSSSSSSESIGLESSVIPSRALLCDNFLASIEELRIRDCREPMPVGGLLGLVHLKELRIDGCQELLASGEEEEEDGRSVLPSSLESLEIYGCCVTNRWLSSCLQGLASLFCLEIDGCTNLTSLPLAQMLHPLTALQVLSIQNCKELTSLGGLHALASLEHLAVAGCPELKSLPEEGLPASIRELGLWRCPQLKSLPEEGLHASIKELYLQECHPALQQQMREKKGLEWDKIAHIPRVYV